MARFAKAGSAKGASAAKTFSAWLEGRMRSFAHAGRGLFLLWSAHWNFRIHLFAAVLVIGLGCVFRISMQEWLVLFFTLALVLAAEALNSAVERLVDLVQAELHPAARDAKDLAAAAVLISAFGAAVIGLMMFGPRFCHWIFSFPRNK